MRSTIALLALAACASFANAQTEILQNLARNAGIFFGAIFDIGQINDQTYLSLLNRQAEWVALENQMKWDATQPSQNQFTFTNADNQVNWVRTNGKKLRCHTLVWHSQLPNWVSSGSWTRAQLTAIIENHVTTLVTRYRGVCTHWDVVNEIWNDDGTLRSSVFSRVFGNTDFVAVAFNAARAADPAAKLYINDYNLDYPGPKVNAMANLVRTLRAQGVPIDGVGSQGHLIVGSVTYNNIFTTLTTFANLGVEVAVTELDIRTNTPASTASLNQQRTDYRNVVAACVAVRGCVGVITWGLTDRFSWIPGVFSGQGAALPWDDNYNPKPAFYGIVDALSAATTVARTSTTAAATTTSRAPTSSAAPTTTRTPTLSPTPTTSRAPTTSAGPSSCVPVTVTTVSTTVSFTTVTVTVTGTVTSRTTAGPSPTTTSRTSAAPTPTSGTCSPRYGQCAGIGWTGALCCQAGSTCTRQNDYFSQCL